MFARSPLPDIDLEDEPDSLIENVKDAGEHSRLRSSAGLKNLQILIASAKQKLSCCLGEEEVTKSGILGKIRGM
jgi:hypothetical protein